MNLVQRKNGEKMNLSRIERKKKNGVILKKRLRGRLSDNNSRKKYRKREKSGISRQLEKGLKRRGSRRPGRMWWGPHENIKFIHGGRGKSSLTNHLENKNAERGAEMAAQVFRRSTCPRAKRK